MWPATVGLVTLLALVFAFAMWVARLGTRASEAGRHFAARGQPNLQATVNPAATGVKQTSTPAVIQASVGLHTLGQNGATGPTERRSDHSEMEREAISGRVG
jgi:hypothetical protein